MKDKVIIHGIWNPNNLLTHADIYVRIDDKESFERGIIDLKAALETFVGKNVSIVIREE